MACRTAGGGRSWFIVGVACQQGGSLGRSLEALDVSPKERGVGNSNTEIINRIGDARSPKEWRIERAERESRLDRNQHEEHRFFFGPRPFAGDVFSVLGLIGRCTSHNGATTGQGIAWLRGGAASEQTAGILAPCQKLQCKYKLQSRHDDVGQAYIEMNSLHGQASRLSI